MTLDIPQLRGECERLKGALLLSRSTAEDALATMETRAAEAAQWHNETQTLMKSRVALIRTADRLRELLREACALAESALPAVPMDMSDEVKRLAAIRKEGGE